VCLPKLDHVYLTDKNSHLQISGFGLFDQPVGQYQRVVQRGTLTTQDRRACSLAWDKRIPDVCIKVNDICPNRGDSGSGLVSTRINDGSYILLALISFGEPSCKRPSVAASIINHMGWIRTIIKQQFANPKSSTAESGEMSKGGDQSLVKAATENNLEVVKELLKRYSVDVNQQNDSGNSALMFAITHGNVAMVEELLKSNINVDLENTAEFTALIWAAKRNELEIVQMLLSRGANVNTQNTWGDTALIFAAANVNTAMIRELHNFNANTDLQNQNGYTALMLAAEKNSLETVRELLKRGANVDKQNRWGTPVLSFAVIQGNTDVLKELLQYGELTSVDTVNVQNNDGTTALIEATNRTSLEIVKTLLQQGAAVDTKKPVWRHSLTLAFTKGVNRPCG